MTDVEICSNACARMGADTFVSFAAETNQAAASGTIYPVVRESILSRHNWHFAAKLAQLSREVATPAAKWTYQYILPSDRLGNTPFEIFTSSTGRIPFKEWEIVGEKLMAHWDTLYCLYVYDVDDDDFPPYFTELMIKAMMAELAIPLWGKDSLPHRNTLMAEVWADGGEFQRAKTADSRNHPPRIMQDFPLVEARHGSESGLVR